MMEPEVIYRQAPWLTRQALISHAGLSLLSFCIGTFLIIDLASSSVPAKFGIVHRNNGNW